MPPYVGGGICGLFVVFAKIVCVVFSRCATRSLGMVLTLGRAAPLAVFGGYVTA
jgi:hypothetical protein